MTYSDLQLSLQPRALWPLDDTAGTAALEVVGAQNGVYHGTFSLNQAGPATGIPSVLLNPGYVTMPQLVDWGGPQITVALWFKKSATQAADAIIWAVGLAGTNGFNLQRDNADGKLYFGEPNVARYYLSTVINDTSWHHLVIVARGASAIDFYMDGGLRATVAPAASVTATTGISLGGDSAGGSLMKGNYSNFLIARYPIDAAMVNGLYGGITGTNLSLPSTYSQAQSASDKLDLILAAVRTIYP